MPAHAESVHALRTQQLESSAGTLASTLTQPPKTSTAGLEEYRQRAIDALVTAARQHYQSMQERPLRQFLGRQLTYDRTLEQVYQHSVRGQVARFLQAELVAMEAVLEQQVPVEWLWPAVDILTAEWLYPTPEIAGSRDNADAALRRQAAFPTTHIAPMLDYAQATQRWLQEVALLHHRPQIAMVIGHSAVESFPELAALDGLHSHLLVQHKPEHGVDIIQRLRGLLGPGRDWLLVDYFGNDGDLAEFIKARDAAMRGQETALIEEVTAKPWLTLRTIVLTDAPPGDGVEMLRQRFKAQDVVTTSDRSSAWMIRQLLVRIAPDAVHPDQAIEQAARDLQARWQA